ncbi:17379_t:CDS:1, partial [Gigaspora margarita]
FTKIPKHKTVAHIYRKRDGFISSILIRGNMTASFKFNKKDIIIKSDKQIKASFATVTLQNSERKTDIVTFELKNITYKKLRKNLTNVTAIKGTIESHDHNIREELENLNLDFELIH